MSRHEKLHGALFLLWIIAIPIGIATGWLWSIAFVSACSIYANAAAHWAAFEGARAEAKERS